MRKTWLLIAAGAIVFGACGETGDAGSSDGGPAPSVVATSTEPPPTLPVTTTQVRPTTTTDAASTTTPGPTTTNATVPLVPLDELEIEWVAVASDFGQPVLVTSAPGDPRLFVVDQPGTIWIIDGDRAVPYLDIRDQVTFAGERGLLGLAFHPDYATNGRFFVDYVDNQSDTVVAEYGLLDRDTADPASARIVLEVDQPASNHNGGMIDFGPDGYLWIAMGDGGASNDKFGNGQRADTLLGAMLRIDVDGAEPYAIPPDNPFADGGAGAPEVWAIGLRNPWRFSFDGDRVVIGDVGQNEREEVSTADPATPGLNYGWPIMEATACFQQSGCDPSGLVAPVVEYRHGDGCSVTGGYVYRGSAIPELEGHYFYGDYCRGWVSSVVIGSSDGLLEPVEWFPPETLPSLTSFGIDAEGELYSTTADGTVWKLQRS